MTADQLLVIVWWVAAISCGLLFLVSCAGLIAGLVEARAARRRAAAVDRSVSL